MKSQLISSITTGVLTDSQKITLACLACLCVFLKWEGGVCDNLLLTPTNNMEKFAMIACKASGDEGGLQSHRLGARI